MAGFFIVMPLIANPQVKIGTISAFMIIAGLFMDVVQIMPTNLSTFAAPKEYASTASGFIGMTQYVGAAISGIIAVALLQKFGYASPFYFCSACCCIAAILISIVGKKIKKQNETL